jgi:DNA-binding MarR family transcriptional regulator
MRLEDELKSKGFASEQTKAVINVMFTASFLHAKISAVLRPFGLSHEQFNVLRILKGQYPNSVAQKDILHRMVDRSSNLTRILLKLKEKELVVVERSSCDKREYEISLSGMALDLLEKLDIVLKQQSSLSELLSTSEAFHLNALLDKMRESM